MLAAEYKRNTPLRWSRVNKTHKTVKHDFKPMMQSMVQKVCLLLALLLADGCTERTPRASTLRIALEHRS